MERNMITAENEAKYPIRPEHIDNEKHFFDTFDNAETEISAGWIVRHCQEKGQSWAPFPRKELDDKHAKKYGNDFSFNRLISEEYIFINENGLVHVTHQFITKCFLSSPALD